MNSQVDESEVDEIVVNEPQFDEVVVSDPQVDEVSSRLSKWKLKLLSIDGRLTLLKSVLTSIPLYHMSIFKVPIGVLNHLESIHQNFFYGVDGSDRKLAWIGWNMVLTSKKNGGLGVSSIFSHNRALLFKWVWRFLTDGSPLWTRFIKAIFSNKGALDTHKLIPRRSPWQDVAFDLLRDALSAIFGLSELKSSDDDNDDDDVKKDEEDEEKEEHLASADPSTVPTDNPVPSS
ncbi:hypothetical protein Tco_0462055 [Tanacetum coccineum]